MTNKTPSSFTGELDTSSQQSETHTSRSFFAYSDKLVNSKIVLNISTTCLYLIEYLWSQIEILFGSDSLSRGLECSDLVMASGRRDGSSRWSPIITNYNKVNSNSKKRS